MNNIQGLDWGTYYWFTFQRNGPGKGLHPIMEAANILGSYFVLAGLAVALMGLLLYLGRQRQAGALGLIVLVAVVLGEGLAWLVQRNRPPDAEIMLGPQMSHGFPNVSALLTSMLFSILAMVLSSLIQSRRRYLLNGLCLILVLLVGASQLYLGLHFLTDLLAGWTAGVLLALVWEFWIGAERQRQPARPRAAN